MVNAERSRSIHRPLSTHCEQWLVTGYDNSSWLLLMLPWWPMVLHSIIIVCIFHRSVGLNVFADKHRLAAVVCLDVIVARAARTGGHGDAPPG